MRASLLLAFALLTAQTCQAQVCPMFMSGEWNGIKYYYCLPKPASGQACTGQNPSLGTSNNAKLLGCNDACDAITVKAAKGVAYLKSHHPDTEAHLDNLVTKRKSGGEPGEGDNTANSFMKGTSGQVLTRGDDKIIKVKKGNNDFFFRVLQITYIPSDVNKEVLVFYIGQQTAAVADFDDNWKFDGNPTGTGMGQNRQHVVISKDQNNDKVIFCLSRDEVVP